MLEIAVWCSRFLNWFFDCVKNKITNEWRNEGLFKELIDMYFRLTDTQSKNYKHSSVLVARYEWWICLWLYVCSHICVYSWRKNVDCAKLHHNLSALLLLMWIWNALQFLPFLAVGVINLCVLFCSGISEDKSPNPVHLATMKAERMNREKAAAVRNWHYFKHYFIHWTYTYCLGRRAPSWGIQVMVTKFRFSHCAVSCSWHWTMSTTELLTITYRDIFVCQTLYGYLSGYVCMLRDILDHSHTRHLQQWIMHQPFRIFCSHTH